MYASTLLLGVVPVIIGRFFVVQSPMLAVRGRVGEADSIPIARCRREPRYPKDVILHRTQGGDQNGEGSRLRSTRSALFKGGNLRVHDSRLGALVPRHPGTYGIGIFTPTILVTVIGAGIGHPRNTAELIQSDLLAT